MDSARTTCASSSASNTTSATPSGEIEMKPAALRHVIASLVATAGLLGAQTALPQAAPAAATAAAASQALTPARIQAALDDAYKTYVNTTGGKNADYIPALAKVDSKIYGIALVTPDGKVYTAGD